MATITKTYTENKIVEVKPIPRSNSLYEQPIARHTGAFVKMDLPTDPDRRARVKVFKDEDEQAFFEKELNLPKGALSVYDRNSKFWNEYLVSVSHEGLTLNLENVSDLLKYKVLKANSHKVAYSWGQRNDDARYLLALVEKGDDNIEINKVQGKKQKAYVFLSSIEDSNDKMIDVLNILGKKIDRTKGAKSDFLKAELFKVIEETTAAPGEVALLDRLLDLASDTNFEYKVLIDKALQAKAIARIGKTGFRLFKGEEEVAEDTLEMVEWFKNPKNQIKVEAIKAQVETYFK
jgi:hypothetical protein